MRRILLPFLAARQTFRLLRTTTVISEFECVARIALIVCLNAITAARAETNGSVELDEIACAFAVKLIKEGRVTVDHKGVWSDHRPSADKENEFIRVHGLREYAKWHLGIDRRFPEDSKQRYKFPYGDFTNVHRCGLLAVKARARQYGYLGIESAATKLEQLIQQLRIAASTPDSDLQP